MPPSCDSWNLQPTVPVFGSNLPVNNIGKAFDNSANMLQPHTHKHFPSLMPLSILCCHLHDWDVNLTVNWLTWTIRIIPPIRS